MSGSLALTSSDSDDSDDSCPRDSPPHTKIETMAEEKVGVHAPNPEVSFPRETVQIYSHIPYNILARVETRGSRGTLCVWMLISSSRPAGVSGHFLPTEKGKQVDGIR